MATATIACMPYLYPVSLRLVVFLSVCLGVWRCRKGHSKAGDIACMNSDSDADIGGEVGSPQGVGATYTSPPLLLLVFPTSQRTDESGRGDSNRT